MNQSILTSSADTQNTTPSSGYTKWAILGVLVVAIVWAYLSYNSIITNDERIKSLDSQVSNMYSRQSELLPKMTSVVNAAANYESSTLAGVTALRGASQNLTKLEELQKSGAIDPAQFSALLATTMSSMKIMGEAYPQLQANTQYTGLFTEVAGSQNRINVAIMDYNDAVGGYNASLRALPFGILFSKWLGFMPKERIFGESEKNQKIDTKAEAVKMNNDAFDKGLER